MIAACQAPVPEFETGIRLPERVPRDAKTETTPTVPPAETEKAPVDDTNPDAGPVKSDPCAAAQLTACFTFEDSVTDAKGALVAEEVTNVAFITGKLGKAARFGTGEGSRVRFTASDAVATADVTVEAFVKLDPTFSQEATVFDVNQRYVMTIEADGRLLCGSNGGAARGNQVAIDKWVHVACVFGGGAVIAYVDGAPGQTSGSFTGMPPSAPAISELAADTPDGTRPFFGAIDNLRVFSVARTPTEIAAAVKP